MQNESEYTISWFRKTKRVILSEAKALDDWIAGENYAEKIKAQLCCDPQDPWILSSLLYAFIICYSRPFVTNSSEYGGNAPTYKISSLRKIVGWSDVQHELFIKLRQKFVAHRDGGDYPGEFITKKYKVLLEGKIFESIIGGTVYVRSIHGMHSAEAVDLALVQIRICRKFAHEQLVEQLSRYVRAASACPAVMKAPGNLASQILS
jgi:hypothetical protein